MCAMKLITLCRLLCYDQVRCILDYILSHPHLSVHITIIFITYIYNIKIKRWWIKGYRWNFLDCFPMREKSQRAQSGVKSFQSLSLQDSLSAQPVVLLKFFSHCWRDQYGFTGASLFYYYSVLSLVQGSTQLSRRIAVIYWETSDSKLQTFVIYHK